MCRHLAYLGRPLSLAEIVLGPAHSLLRQTWAPADMRGGGSVNADGFGIGWYDDNGDSVRYRRREPMWADASLPEMARSIRSSAVLAATRNGTVGMPVSETACAPFGHGPWLFSHNGTIEGWPDSVAALAAELPVTDLLTLDAPTDSALVWALLRARLRAGEDATSATAGVFERLLAAAPGSRLNLLLTDGEVVVATAWTHGLFLLHDSAGVWLSSEPLDDRAWEPVPEGRLVTATRRDTRIRELETTPVHRPTTMEAAPR